MSGRLDQESFRSRAAELEKEYAWEAAAECYDQVSELMRVQGSSGIGEVYERSGYALYRAAFQVGGSEEFRDRMQRAIVIYGKAKEVYEQTNDGSRVPRLLRCDAMISFCGYWLTPQASEKKKLLDECWRLTKEAFKFLDETGRSLEYGETYNQLSSSADFVYGFESSFQLREDLIREGMQYGERAITLLSSVNAPYELARARVKTAMFLSIFAWYFVSDMDEKDGYYRKGLGYWQKAKEFSEETAYLELLSMSGEGLDWDTEEMLFEYGKALEFARKTKDRFLMGIALDWMTYAAGDITEEDPDKVMQLLDRALQYAKDTANQFSPISYVSPRGAQVWTGGPCGEYYGRLAFRETDLRRKRGFLERAIVEETAAVRHAEDVGYPDVVMLTHGVMSSLLVSLTKTETDSEEKRRLLESAVEHVRAGMKLREELERYLYWNLGGGWQHLANLRAELSRLEADDEKKRKMLEEAVSLKERGLQLCIRYSLHAEKKGNLSYSGPLGFMYDVYAEMLDRLYGLTHNVDFQRKALKAFEDSAESYQKLNLVSRVAESLWKVARVHDAFGEHLKAAGNFSLASDNYKRAADKIPQLKDFYLSHAGYMQAWTEIETARDHHERQEYALAKEHFKKAGDLHKSLKQWGYLAPNYFAWARLEEAEELSRKEQAEKAVKAFESAVELFVETKKALQMQLDKIEDPDEKQMATSMVKATDTRREYSLARVAVEEAKILDKKGDHYRSSEKYGSAVEAFEKIGKSLESEGERREFRLIVALSRAWQKMTLAEAEASPALYVEASQLFEEAREFCPNEKMKVLLHGHSRFCKALEAGTEFADSRSMNMYGDAVRFLESAASYYVKAGFPKASEYSEATKLLFDAYVHSENASRESDPERKVKLYAMAEKVLQTSAGSFLRAEHPEKREQVLGLLEKVKKEQEVATSLMEVLHAPAIVSATTSFSTPASTREQAVGSERFEHADIQANLIIRQKELKIGENLYIELELVNAGKGSALLTKITEIIPKGFELAEKPETFRVEDSYLNLKGKRLDPLKTEEVKLVLRPTLQGAFSLKPTVLYLDENGKYRSHEPAPVVIVVKELGVKGWLKGER